MSDRGPNAAEPMLRVSSADRMSGTEDLSGDYRLSESAGFHSGPHSEPHSEPHSGAAPCSGEIFAFK